MANARRVDYFGYANCIKLDNKNTSVVLGPHCGGRILEYAWQGKNALYLNPEQQGATSQIFTSRGAKFGPCGGRFDVGPEWTMPKHPALWFGEWQAEIIEPRAARMTSVKDKVTGVQLVRDFELDESSSHLKCTQTIRNVSEQTRVLCLLRK